MNAEIKADKPTKRPQGRPVVPPEHRLIVRGVRLTLGQWGKLSLLGGADWLRAKINAAKLPKD